MNNRTKGSISNEDIEKLQSIYNQHIKDGDIEERYGIIVVMDVLGWKNKATEKTIKTYLDLINRLRARILENWVRVDDDVKDEDLYIVVMSDTVCVFLNIDDRYCELNIFKFISEFIIDALVHSLAFRGAISRGKYFINKKHNVFVGEAVYEAMEYAEKTEWAGIILTNSMAKVLLEKNDIEKLKELNIISYDNIPYKNNIAPCYRNLVIVPKMLFTPPQRNIFVDLMGLYEKVLESENKDVKKKLENTKSFLEFLVKQNI